MWCCKCDRDVADCVCPDIDERLNSALGGPVAFRRCKKCGKHYARCRCLQPDWEFAGGPALPGEKEKN